MPMIIKNNVRYCSTGGDAESIVYDNAESGMEATNMQDAIDELNSNLGVRYNAETDTVQIFYNGIWNDWKRGDMQDVYLYYYGDENTMLTGGYNTNTIGSNIPANMSPYLNKNGANMVFGSGNNSNMYSGDATLNTILPIDITNYKKIEFKLSEYSVQSCKIHVNDEQGKTNCEAELGITAKGIHELDISNLSGKYYIGITIGVPLNSNKSITIDYIKLLRSY